MGRVPGGFQEGSRRVPGGFQEGSGVPYAGGCQGR